MNDRIKLHISDFMQKKGMSATDLMRKGEMSYGTALRLSKNDAESITFDVLARLCDILSCTPGDLLEYIPDAPKEESAGKARGKKKG